MTHNIRSGREKERKGEEKVGIEYGNGDLKEPISSLILEKLTERSAALDNWPFLAG